MGYHHHEPSAALYDTVTPIAVSKYDRMVEGRDNSMRPFCAIVGLAIFLNAGWACAGAWHDPGSQYRREITIPGDSKRIGAEDLGHVRFLCNGKQLPDASDVRVTTPTGRPLASRVIMSGPGDCLDLVFNTVAGERAYLIYFANPKPRPNSDDELARAGLLLETKPLRFENFNSSQELEAAWKRLDKTPAVGQRMIARPFLGINLFGGPPQSITRLTGRLYAPTSGTYTFAVAADDRGALFIDGKSVVFCRYPVGDVRFQEPVNLERGWHDFLFYQADAGAEYAFSVVWRRPDSGSFAVIPPETFGSVLDATAGPLEQQNKTVTSDMQATYLGESFFANNYSYRYGFAFASTLKQPERAQCQWDFGDGQRAQGRQVEHVYLTAGTYTVTVETKLGVLADTQSFRLPVNRDIEHSNEPPTDVLSVHSKIVAGYDVSRLTEESLPWAVIMHLRADNLDASIAAATAMASVPHHSDTAPAIRALQELGDVLARKKSSDRLAAALAATPPQSNLYPWASRERARLLAYSMGDFAQAVKVLEASPAKDEATRRTYGQVLILASRADEGRKILEALPISAAKQKAAAISGAMARTTEFYVQEKDPENGEKSWDKWMAAFPADFLEGNAIDMRVKLIAARGNTAVAAQVAEAFANALPQSAYSPRLLDTASRLLESTDAAKSKALRQLLKQRYPEDPLSQK